MTSFNEFYYINELRSNTYSFQTSAKVNGRIDVNLIGNQKLMVAFVPYRKSRVNGSICILSKTLC